MVGPYYFTFAHLWLGILFQQHKLPFLEFLPTYDTFEVLMGEGLITSKQTDSMERKFKGKGFVCQSIRERSYTPLISRFCLLS